MRAVCQPPISPPVHSSIRIPSFCVAYFPPLYSPDSTNICPSSLATERQAPERPSLGCEDGLLLDTSRFAQRAAATVLARAVNASTTHSTLLRAASTNSDCFPKISTGHRARRRFCPTRASTMSEKMSHISAKIEVQRQPYTHHPTPKDVSGGRGGGDEDGGRCLHELPAPFSPARSFQLRRLSTSREAARSLLSFQEPTGKKESRISSGNKMSGLCRLASSVAASGPRPALSHVLQRKRWACRSSSVCLPIHCSSSPYSLTSHPPGAPYGTDGATDCASSSGRQVEL